MQVIKSGSSDEEDGADGVGAYISNTGGHETASPHTVAEDLGVGSLAATIARVEMTQKTGRRCPASAWSFGFNR